MVSRRNFLKKSALSLAALGTPLARSLKGTNNLFPSESTSIGIAGWTFRFVDNEDAAEMMQRLNVKEVTLKDFQLPLDSSQEEIDQTLQMFSEAGVSVYGVGVIYMETKDEVDQAFEYAEKADVPIIVGVPTYELIPYSEKKVKEYDIKLAIHNHGPEDDLYPSPGDVYEKVKDLDPRMGLCFDIGHGERAGTIAAEGFNQYHDRIFDMHIKDVTEASKDGQSVAVGRGIIDFESFIQALAEKNYTGYYSLEYEDNMREPLAGIAESIGYFRGVFSTI